MELVKVEFFLVNKRTDKKKKAEEEANKLISEVQVVLKQIEELGYSEDKVDSVRSSLLGKYSHPLLVSDSKEKELERIGQFIVGWKPVFTMLDMCDPNLESFRKVLSKNLLKKEIIRIETLVTQDSEGDDEDEELISKRKTVKTYVSAEEFIQEMLNFEWEGFGMPAKYNSKEDTIWSYD